jgi:DNA-binding response OmpR family regulator
LDVAKNDRFRTLKAIRLKNNTTLLFFLTARDTVQETIEGLKADQRYIKKNLLVLMNY